jgi:hypothetical protein
MVDFTEMSKRIEREAARLQEGVGDAVADVAAQILAKSQDRVPVVTGELRDSGEVRRDGDTATVRYSADYADDVHENPASEGYRFLESAVQEEASGFADAVAAAAKARGA